ncbi:DEAD DEAH box helicase [Coemansia sp. Benny D115]|nr:DEAD DEAH box helicase [Coemansia sp. Benny D115]
MLAQWRTRLVAQRRMLPLSSALRTQLQSRQQHTSTAAAADAVATPASSTSLHDLRPYQRECIEACLDRLRRGVRRQAVSLPVGSGKTVIFSSLIQQIPAPTEMATKTLVLAHREELLNQAARQIQNAAPHLVVAIDQGTRKANPAADVIVASVATLGRENSPRLNRHDPRRFKCVVIDEAHHAAASTYTRVIDYLDAGSGGALVVWGCSATLQRHDGLGLNQIFDEITYQKHFVQMVRDGWLSGLRVVNVRTYAKVDTVRVHAGDFSTSELSLAVNSGERNLAVVEAYRKLAAGRRKSTLVFAVDVAHAMALCQAFHDHGRLAAEVVVGKTPVAERERILAEFRRGTLPVLVNCGILTEGTDIPNIDCVMMARPTRSSVLFQQMVGRGMRLSPGKSDCLLVDFVDSFRTGAAPITVPTLLGLDPDLILKETDLLDAESLASQQKAHKPMRSPKEEELDRLAGQLQELDPTQSRDPDAGQDAVCMPGMRFVESLDPIRLFNSTSMSESLSCGNEALRSISPLAWVCLSPQRYMLDAHGTFYYVTYDAEDRIWRGSSRVQRVFSSKTASRSKPQQAVMFYSPEKPIEFKAQSLPQGLRAVDSLLRANLSFMAYKKLSWREAWRSKPPTESQLKMLKRLGLEVPSAAGTASIQKGARDADTQGTTVPLASGSVPGGLTRGMATNLIARLNHGAGKAARDIKKLYSDVAAERAARQAENARRALWVPMAPGKSGKSGAQAD